MRNLLLRFPGGRQQPKSVVDSMRVNDICGGMGIQRAQDISEIAQQTRDANGYDLAYVCGAFLAQRPPNIRQHTWGNCLAGRKIAN